MTSQIDLRELRNAFGTFMTGVTVVTTVETDSTPRGFTANSFTSVSLDPPLLSICIGKSADSVDVFKVADGFAINILSEKQKETSSLFASKRADKFNLTKWGKGPAGNPILDSVCAWFDCKLQQQIDAGDHVILIGKVQGFDYNDQNGLGYVRGGYVTLGLEQAAVTAAGHDSKVVVGALVDCNGKILLRPSPTSGRLQLVASGLDNRRGSISRLKVILDDLKIGAVIKSLYAVFENEETEQQFIFYRAIADHEDKDKSFYAQHEIPWERLEDEAMITMVKRYFEESHDQRYGVYFGSQNSGTVQRSD